MFPLSQNGGLQGDRKVRYTGYASDGTTVVNADLSAGSVLQALAGYTTGSPLTDKDGNATADDAYAFGQPKASSAPGIFAVVREDLMPHQLTAINTQAGVTANLRNGGPVGANFTGNTRALIKAAAVLAAGITLLEPVDGQFYLQPCSRMNEHTLYSAVADSTAISNTAVETAFDLSYTIPANSLNVGDVLHIRAVGSCVTNSTDTLVIKLYIGSQEVIATGTIDAASGDGFVIDAFVTIRTIGTSGTYVAGGLTSIETPGAAAGAADIPSSDYLGSTAINTTTTNAITVKATFNAASTGSTTTLQQLIVTKIGKSSLGFGPIAVAMESATVGASAALKKVWLTQQMH